MISSRPYLIRALFQWLVDCGLTPHLLVDINGDDVIVPTQYAKDGRIVLNVSPNAVRDLELGNDLITFNARFSGQPMDVSIPPSSVLGIYARENGYGMLFPDEEEGADVASGDEPKPPQPPHDRPRLKIVK